MPHFRGSVQNRDRTHFPAVVSTATLRSSCFLRFLRTPHDPRADYDRVKPLVPALYKNVWDNRQVMDTSSLDFVYLESDPRTQQPSACIYLKAGNAQDYAGLKADRLITAQCLSFIELDAEIRRLHAELDE